MSIIVKANVIRETKLFKLVPVFTNPNNSSLFDFFSKKVLYHGTSEGLIGKQLELGHFENRGKRIYADDRSTAVRYALIAAKGDKTKPLVLKISSTIKPVWNEISKSGWGLGLGSYPYFPPGPDQNVKIEIAYEVLDHD